MGIKRKIKLIKQKERMTPCIYGTIQPKILLTRRNIRKTRRSNKTYFNA